jgi:GNAT superfamily N-acetyltransferase
MSADLETLGQFQAAVVAAERAFDATLRAGPIAYYDLAALLVADRARVVVATHAGEPVGCGLARLDPAEPFLNHTLQGYLGLMYTAPAHRGRGVNRRILDTLVAWVRAQGVCELRLEVYSGNAAALRAYLKQGFRPHLLEMRLALDAQREPD